jgi:hypothetical protein
MSKNSSVIQRLVSLGLWLTLLGLTFVVLLRSRASTPSPKADQPVGRRHLVMLLARRHHASCEILDIDQPSTGNPPAHRGPTEGKSE